MAAPTTAACVKKTLANPEPSTHGPSRHVAPRWPSVTNGALRTRLDLLPARSRLTRGSHQVGTLKKGLLAARSSLLRPGPHPDCRAAPIAPYAPTPRRRRARIVHFIHGPRFALKPGSPHCIGPEVASHAEGIAPPRAPKTVLEPLDSHGFRCSAPDIEETANEQRRARWRRRPMKPWRPSLH
jgi:hypothetical protein